MSRLLLAGAALLLRRIEQTQALAWPSNERAELRADINALQRQHFADAEPQNGDAAKLRPTVERWTQRANTGK